MENKVQVFSNEEFGRIRTAGTAENPTFCLADLCRALEIGNPSDVKNRLDKGVVSIETLQTAGGMQKMTFVNEDGLYDVILDSRKPEAKKFRKWITSEVLPSIRKTGSYSLTPKVATPTADIIADVKETKLAIQDLFSVQNGIALAQAIDTVSELRGVNLQNLKQLLPPAEHSTGYLNSTQIGEKLGGIPAKAVNIMLAEKGLQYKDGRNWRISDEGAVYGEEMPFTKNGHSGYQIRWNSNVMEVFRNGK